MIPCFQDLNRQIRDKKLRGVDLSREGKQITAGAKDDKTRDQLQQLILDAGNGELLVQQQNGSRRLAATLKPEAINALQLKAVRRNMDILRNRINELGVAGEEIKRKGTDRIVVRLPGTADVARVREVIGGNTTLEIRLVDDTPALLEQALEGQVPQGVELYIDSGRGEPLLVKKQAVLTGEHIVDAEPAFSSYDFRPVVNLVFDHIGAKVFKEATRENVGKRMAIMLFEKGEGKVVIAPVISSEIGDGRVQLTAAMTTSEMRDLALLLRAGALAAPMTIIDEQPIGPSSGKNATK